MIFDDNDIKALGITQQLNDEIGSARADSIKDKNEYYLMHDEKFLALVQSARSKLGLTNTEIIGEMELDDWLKKNIKLSREYLEDPDRERYIVRADGKKSTSEDPSNAFRDIVQDIANHLSLGGDWTQYISYFIVNGTSNPNSPGVYADVKILLKNIEDDGLTIKIKPGLRYEDYVKAWKVFSEHLGPPERLEKPHTNAKINQAIYEDRQAGMSYTEIAEKYFDSESPLVYKDQVVKIIRREEKRRRTNTTK